MPEESVTFLKSLPYFEALPPQALAELAARSRRRIYARGELVVLQGEPAEAVYFVVSGQVRVHVLSPEGRVQVLERLGPGQGFNQVPVFDGRPNPASVAAVGRAMVLSIPRPVLLEMLQRYPSVAEAVLADFASRLRRLAQLVEDLSLRTVRGRLARYLLSQAGRPGRRLTRAEMAADLGTVREVVSRLLGEFQDEGLIAIERHRIHLCDRARLEAMGD